jgi:hypothetical protein
LSLAIAIVTMASEREFTCDLKTRPRSQFCAARPVRMSVSRLMTDGVSQVPAEQRESYAAIIDEILASADLETISAKRIRNGLQARVDYDLTPQKVGSFDGTSWKSY